MTDPTLPPSLSEARDWITEDDFDGAFELLHPLLSGLADGGSRPWQSLRNELVMQAGRHAANRKQDRRGTITIEQSGIVTNRLRMAMLDLIDDIERRLKRASDPVPPSPVPLDSIDSAALSGNPEKIIGRNSLKSIAWLAQGLQASRAVCRIRTPQWTGTGFHIGGGRIVTNHHVIPDAATAARAQVEFNFQRDAEGRMAQSVVYPASAEGFVAMPVPLDCAVFHVPDLSPDWGHLTFATDTAVEAGAPVSIIQHPLGGEKQIAVTANEVVALAPPRLIYLTDTLGGSSGAPVFDENWQVCALHRAGAAAARGPDQRLHRGNEGILATALLADPTLGPALASRP